MSDITSVTTSAYPAIFPSDYHSLLAPAEAATFFTVPLPQSSEYSQPDSRDTALLASQKLAVLLQPVRRPADNSTAGLVQPDEAACIRASPACKNTLDLPATVTPSGRASDAKSMASYLAASSAIAGHAGLQQSMDETA
ncbi:hypothetical protein [Comamonas composti]|uniref:hypothetical protein n=1 Tax=Comamonas composti TaxID=408558 RepID=UPI0004245B03|nr:hypothetical protein [Comamonas composti]